jgi:hypothetical protein
VKLTVMRASLTAALALAATAGLGAGLSRLCSSLGMPWWNVSIVASLSAMAAIAVAWPVARVDGSGATAMVASACYLAIGMIAPLTTLTSLVTGLAAPAWVDPTLFGMTFLSAGLYMRGTDPSIRESAAARLPRIRRATQE